MRSSSPKPDSAESLSSKVAPRQSDLGAPSSSAGAAAEKESAAVAPIPQPVAVTENPLPAATADSPKEALGRRTLSTAFVRIGPDGHLTVELRGGRVLVLRDVVMRSKDYCGTMVSGGPDGAKKYCGGYADVAAARPGGGPLPR